MGYLVNLKLNFHGFCVSPSIYTVFFQELNHYVNGALKTKAFIALMV
jgi:hypothetical protein